MVKNIINQGLAALYNPQEIVDLENQYGNTYGIKNSSSGLLSDARHMAAMNNLSNTLSNSGLGIAMGLPSELAGDVAAFGAGLINELPALGRGFNKQNLGEITEDIAANYAGSFGTPNTATARGIYDTVFEGPASTITTDADVRTAANIANNYGTAQAAEVTPQNEPMDIEDFLGTSTPQDLGFIGMAPSIKEAVGITDRNRGQSYFDPVTRTEVAAPNAQGRPSMADIAGPINENLRDLGNPLGDSRVASEEMGLVGGIPDRGRGMPGTMGAYEMIGGTPVAVGDVLGMQQALEKADFYEEPTRGINYDALGILGTIGGLLTGSLPAKALGMYGNFKSGRTGRALDGISRGLGSLGTKISGKMRGINPTTRRPNTQAQYEANRAARQAQSRTDRMIDRISKGKRTRSNPRDAGTTQAQKDAISAALQDKQRGAQYGPSGDQGSGGSTKIVCTMMNERYGFGSFRNKIWMKFHEHHGPEYQKGYHAIFLPLVKIAKGEGKINTAVRKVLEHMGRHVTADMFKIMKGKKRDTLGRIYRAIFEPACHIIGKIKSALGRG